MTIRSDTSALLDTTFVLDTLGLHDHHPMHQPRIFSEITTDSRKVMQDSLFVALQGERVDGHDYIPGVIKAGATGIICRNGTAERFRDLNSGAYFFEVEDPLKAYRTLAQCWRLKFDIPIIAVAGSAGKTTTKELLASILTGKWHSVLKTQASQNGFIGIPMTLLALRPHHQAAVIEIGIDECGAMIQHMELVQPKAALLTAIGPEHLEKLKDVPTVAHEESIALRTVAQKNGWIIVNLDDPWIEPLSQLKTEKKLGFSLHLTDHPELAVLHGKLHSSPDASHDEFSLSLKNREVLRVRPPLPGQHNLANLLGAIAMAYSLGLSFSEIERGLNSFQGAEGRSDVRILAGSTTVLCDYYNAQPASMKAGIQMLCDFYSKSVAGKSGNTKKRWAVLGDMLELGSAEEGFHREIAHQLMEEGIENVLLYGPRMIFLSDELKLRGFRGYHAHFNTHAELAQELISRFQPGDTLLIKGSRGMKMEEVWKILQDYTSTHWNELKVKS